MTESKATDGGGEGTAGELAERAESFRSADGPITVTNRSVHADLDERAVTLLNTQAAELREMREKQETVDCQSCGATIEAIEGVDDHECQGCKLNVCQSCVDVFQHFAGGDHGTGDPAEAVAALRTRADQLEAELATEKRTAKLTQRDLEMLRDQQEMAGTTIEAAVHRAEQAEAENKEFVSLLRAALTKDDERLARIAALEGERDDWMTTAKRQTKIKHDALARIAALEGALGPAYRCLVHFLPPPSHTLEEIESQEHYDEAHAVAGVKADILSVMPTLATPTPPTTGGNPIPDCDCGHLWALHEAGGGACESCDRCPGYSRTTGGAESENTKRLDCVHRWQENPADSTRQCCAKCGETCKNPYAIKPATLSEWDPKTGEPSYLEVDEPAPVSGGGAESEGEVSDACRVGTCEACPRCSCECHAARPDTDDAATDADMAARVVATMDSERTILKRKREAWEKWVAQGKASRPDTEQGQE